MQTKRFRAQFLAQWGCLSAGVVAIGLAFPGGVLAGVIIVRDGDSIQAAVDAASPGDTITIPLTPRGGR